MKVTLLIGRGLIKSLVLGVRFITRLIGRLFCDLKYVNKHSTIKINHV